MTTHSPSVPEQDIAPKEGTKTSSKTRTPWANKLHSLVGFALPLALIIFWHIASTLAWLPDNLLPAPATVLTTFVQITQDGTLAANLLASLARWSSGFLLGSSIGLLVGSFVGLSRLVENIIDTSIQMLRTVPFLALAPLLILWLGLDEAPKITLVALASFFPVYINTFAGIRNVDRKLIEVGQIYQLSPIQLLLRVILPASLPEILTGIRYSLAVAWLALVVAELLGASQGLGYLLSEGREFLRVDLVLCTIVVFAIFGKIFDLIIRLLEFYFLRWRDTYRGEKPS